MNRNVNRNDIGSPGIFDCHFNDRLFRSFKIHLQRESGDLRHVAGGEQWGCAAAGVEQRMAHDDTWVAHLRRLAADLQGHQCHGRAHHLQDRQVQCT